MFRSCLFDVWWPLHVTIFCHGCLAKNIFKDSPFARHFSMAALPLMSYFHPCFFRLWLLKTRHSRKQCRIYWSRKRFTNTLATFRTQECPFFVAGETCNMGRNPLRPNTYPTIVFRRQGHRLRELMVQMGYRILLHVKKPIVWGPIWCIHEVKFALKLAKCSPRNEAVSA